MKDVFTINLDEESFNKVLDETKTVHLDINDKNHKVMEVGNQLTFVEEKEDGEKQEQKAEIENLLFFGNILEAVETLGKEKCGFKPSATFEKTSDLFLSTESVESMEKFGIIAIVFKILK